MDLTPLWDALGRLLPFEWLGEPYVPMFRRTLVALALLAPALGLLGVQVVNARYAFFSDAVSHATLAGLGLAAFADVDPRWALPFFAAAFGLSITWMKRRGRLSVDTATGVCFAVVTAAGICLLRKFPPPGGGVDAVLFGQGAGLVLDVDVLCLAGLLAATVLFMALAGNRLVLVGLDDRLAAAHGLRAALYEYAFTALLAATVAVAARMAGVLLVTAMLVVPAVAGRNFSRSWRGQCWWSMAVALLSVTAGYGLALQDAVNLPTGALSVLCAATAFAASLAKKKAMHNS